MYEKHFSFKHKPFDLVPNPDFLFLSSTHKKAITYLDYGIKEKIGFILLTGEVGSGKTTILRNLIKNLHGSIKLSRVHNTKVSSDQLISMINEDFGLAIEGKSKTRLLSELNEFLINQYAKKIQPILLIDEAQNLSPDLLEEIRLLSNLETDRAKLLQIILVGQPELKKMLLLPELVQLRQRININYHIAPLSMDETAKYIKHRLTVAGNPDAIAFQDEILHIIYEFSRGIPRLINILCDFALLAGYVEGKKQINIDIIREVAKDLESRDYWNDDEQNEGLSVQREIYDPGLSNVSENLARKIIELEIAIKSILTEMTSLKDKSDQFHKEINESVAKVRDGQIDLLSARVVSLERIINAVNHERQESGFDLENNRSFVEQLSLLIKKIGDVDNKLKSL